MDDAAGFKPQDAFRLAIVASSADELARKLKLAATQADNEQARSLLAEQGVFFGEPSLREPRVVFLFPGQGSQYIGMLKELVQELPAAAEAQRQVDAALSRLGLPSFAQLAWEDGDGLGRNVARTQFALLCADAILAAAAHALGLKPERVAGHSFGELAALFAAGAWTFEDALAATLQRCRAIESCTRSAGVMLSTSAPAEALEELIARAAAGRAWISHRNAPEQTVCGGEEDAIRALAVAVEQAGYKTKLLDVPAAFHTPLMEEVKQPFGRALAQIPLAPPRIPLLSSVTGRYVAEPDDIRENLVVQMTRPVPWVDLARRLADEGFNLLIEVGPKQVLTGLGKSIVGSRDVTVVGTDHPKRPGLQQLFYAKAGAEACGALDVDEQRPTLAWNRKPSAALPPESTDAASGGAEDDAPRRDGQLVLRVAGSPYEMGIAHGRAQAEAIRRVIRRYADLAGTRWDRLRDLTSAAARADVYFGPDELEELRGIAKGAEVTLESIIAHNLRLYLDAGAGGLHFAVTAAENRGEGLLHAANEDLQMALPAGDCLERNVIVRTPAKGISYVTFGVAGQIGALNGINACGLAVTTSALLDVPATAGALEARLHTVLVKAVLEGAADIEQALAIIRANKSAAAFSLCLSHAASDRLCYVEFDGRELKVQPAPSAVMAANHRLLKTFPEEPPAASRHRLERFRELLGGERPGDLDVSRLQEALRDQLDRSRGREQMRPTINTVRRVDNQISLIMQPGRGRAWVTPGPRANGHQNGYLELDLRTLLPDAAGREVDVVDPRSKAAPDAGQHHPSVIDAAALVRSYADAEAAEHGADVCLRYVMRVVESPLPSVASATVSPAGTAVVLGRNAAADALCRRIEQEGARVVQIPPQSGSGDIETVLAELDDVWNAAPATRLFLMTACDAEAVTGLDPAWSKRRATGVLLPYRVCQQWYQRCLEAGLLGEATLVAATTLGGDFGFSGANRNAESGALAGLVKGVEMELRLQRRVTGFVGKIVDFDAAESPESIAAAICREVAAGDGELEAGYIGGRRYVPRPVVVPLPAGNERSAVRPGDVFVVTGGARGVTAEVARELGTRFGVKLHLIGSSPPPQIPDAYHNLSADELKDLKSAVMKDALAAGNKPLDAWSAFEKSLEIDRNLRSFAAAGLTASYHTCDISDRTSLVAVLEQIRAADGPIGGIVHGAGYERAASFEKKQPELVDRTIAAKVDGAALLMELTRQDPVKLFAAFGSVSGRFGGVGQTDYCVANEMLAKLIDWYRSERPDCRATVFHWHAWDDVGMAVRPESKHIAKLHNIRFMPAREGTRHLLDELAAGLPEPEIVITELAYCRDKYAVVQAASLQPTAARLAAPQGSGHPLLDAIIEHEPGRSLLAESRLDPVADVFLAQHRFKERPMLPVVATLEALAEAAAALAGDGRRVAALGEIEILNGLRFLTDEPQTARIRAAMQADGRIASEFTCDLRNRKGQVLLKDKPYLRANVSLADSSAASTRSIFPRRMPESWTTCWYPEEDVVIWHDEPFRCLREIAVEGDEAWGRLLAPDPGDLAGRRGERGWIMPSALLDACFFACGIVLWWKHRGVVAIPDGIEAVRLGRTPRSGEACLVHITDRGRQENRALYDFAVFGEDGTCLFEVDGYRNVIVAEAPVHAGR
ncbi:MAG: acyltransferase domain-containing protein [Planctomycetes bacterium]|nr:acyltransferase domain-containing protein [Planctomycetota bacterium]